MNSPAPVSDDDLHAYLDGHLDPQRAAAVERHLAAHPGDAERVNAYRHLNDLLHEQFDGVLEETLPPRLTRLPANDRSWPWLRVAAAVAWVALGGVIGWGLHGVQPAPGNGVLLARQAAVAHVVYTPEVRHPVEVPADQESHLLAWLSKRLGGPVRAPHFGPLGYELVGGRLLPAAEGPAAQFMYQDGRGARLTLYVRKNAADNAETAFRFAEEGKVKVFYWVDGPFGYALSGEIGRDELLRAANAAYHELNP